MRAGSSAVTILLLFVFSVAPVLAATGTLLVVNKSDDTLSMLDLETGSVVAVLPTGSGPHEVVVSPDGTTAVISNYGPGEQPGNSLTVIDVADAAVVSTIDLGDYRHPHGLAWLPDNRRILVTAEDNRALLLVDVTQGAVERVIKTDAAVSHMVAIDPAARYAYVANIGSGSVSVIDIQAGRLQTTIAAGAGTEGIAVSPDGRQLWATNREAGTVTVMDAKSMEVLTTLPVTGFPIRVKLSPDGKEALVSRATASRVEFFDTETLESKGEVSMPREFNLSRGRWLGGGFGYRTLPIGILYHPDGKTVYVANAYGGFIAVLDVASRRVTATLQAGTEPDGLAYSHLGPGSAVR